jgi:hypothetical protein
VSTLPTASSTTARVERWTATVNNMTSAAGETVSEKVVSTTRMAASTVG